MARTQLGNAYGSSFSVGAGSGGYRGGGIQTPGQMGRINAGSAVEKENIRRARQGVPALRQGDNMWRMLNQKDKAAGIGRQQQPYSGPPRNLLEAQNQANAANQGRYDQLLGMYGGMMGQLGFGGGQSGTQQGGTQARPRGTPTAKNGGVWSENQGKFVWPGPGSGQMPQRTGGGQQQAGASASAGGGTPFDRSERQQRQRLGLTEQFGNTQKELIDRQQTQRQGQARQQLIGSGLGNTTIGPSVNRGIAQDADFQRRAVDEQKTLMQSGIMGDISGQSERMGDRGLGMFGDLTRMIENRSDVGPDLGMYAQLIQQANSGPSSQGMRGVYGSTRPSRNELLGGGGGQAPLSRRFSGGQQQQRWRDWSRGGAIVNYDTGYPYRG